MSLPAGRDAQKGKTEVQNITWDFGEKELGPAFPWISTVGVWPQTLRVSRNILEVFRARNVCTIPDTKAMMPWRNSHRLLWEPLREHLQGSWADAGLGAFLLPWICRLHVDRHTWDALDGGKSYLNVFPKQSIYPHLLQNHPRGWVGWYPLVERN